MHIKKGYGHLRKKPEVIYNFIEEHRHEYRVSKMCQVLGVSKSGYYNWRAREKSPQKERHESLVRHVKRVHLESRKIYGSPKITEKLNQEGISVSQKTVGRIVKEEGIHSKTVKKYKATTNSKHSLPVYPNLLNQQFHVEEPGKVWVGDITYIWTKEGWLYLATIMDLYSRRILGWYMSERMTKELVITALKRAIGRQTLSEDLIHHSDRGSQYASHDYLNTLRRYRISTSMSRKGNCYDNACIESFHSIIKRELIYLETYVTRQQAKDSIIEYIECLNNTMRIHSTNGYLSPVDKEKAYYQGLSVDVEGSPLTLS